MWDMRRSLDPDAAAAQAHARSISCTPSCTSAKRSWWLVIDGGKVDLCSTNPGFEIDLYVQELAPQHDRRVDGHDRPCKKEMAAGQMELIGDKPIAQSMQQWLGLSPFAKEKSRVAA